MPSPTDYSAATNLALAAPLSCIALAQFARRPRSPHRLRRFTTIVAASGIVVAVVAAAAVAFNGTLESSTLGVRGLGASVRLDALSTIMLTMIALLAAVIMRFSWTYLDGDPRRNAFIARLAVTVAAVEVLVLSGNLALFVGAWIATSLALHQLLVFYGSRRRAVVAARKKFVSARVGDALLLTAVALLWWSYGTGNMQKIFADVAADTGALPLGVQVAGLCIAIAALLKSAQFPTHGWLVEVMETPTPVSALLHAGILNAGPFLAIRMAYVLDLSRPATLTLVIVGGGTALFASVVLLTQPSVKVALGYSSVAHMGFMLMVCGAGLYAAALLHLVAHSFYKAHAFLASGSQVDEARARSVALPKRLGSATRLLASLGIAVACYFALAQMFGIDLVREPRLIAVAAILVMGTTQLVAPALDSDGPLAGVLRVSVLALGVTTSFFVLETAMLELLGPTIPEAAARSVVEGIALAAIVASFGAAVATQIFAPARPRLRNRRLAVHLRNGLYANALFDRLVGALRANPTALEHS